MSIFTFDKDKHINSIIENFDFVKVHETMKLLNWQWWYCGVPSVEQLKKTSIGLLSEVYDSSYDTYAISTGGFKAVKREDYIELEFILCEWDSSEVNNHPDYERIKKLKLRKKKLTKMQENEDN